MSAPSPSSRPRQVTLAGWLTMLGSAAVVVMVFDQVAGLRSLETRESVQRFLSEPPGRDLGVGVEGALALLHTLAMVTAGCATAAAILGYHVLRRSRSARLALTVVVVPLLFAGLVTGGFVTTVVAASVGMLWLQPARDWFDGVHRPAPDPTRPPAASPYAGTSAGPPSPGQQPPAPQPPAEQPPAQQPPPQAPQAPQPPPTQPPTQPPGQPWGQPSGQPWGRQYGQPWGAHQPVQRPGASAYGSNDRRPTAVVWACALTWVFSGMAALGMVASALAVAFGPQSLFDEVRRQNPELVRQGISDNAIAAATYVMAAVIVVWCVGAVAFSILVFRGVGWARIPLVVSAAMAAALCLVGALVGGFLLFVPLLASAGAIALLGRPEARAWFASRT